MSKKNQKKLDEYYQLILEYKQSNIYAMKEKTEELLKYSYQYNDSYGQAFAFIHLAIFYITTRELASAQYNLMKAKKICLRSNYDQLLISYYACRGTVCQLNGHKVEAIRLYGKALYLAEKHEEHMMMGVLYNNIGDILNGYEDMELAKKYLMLAIDKLLQFPQQRYNLAQVYAHLVSVYCDLHDVANAYIYLAKAQSLYFENDIALGAIKASELRLYAEEQAIPKIKQAYIEYTKIISREDIQASVFLSNHLLVLESLSLVNLKEEFHLLFTVAKESCDNTNVEYALKLCKLYIRFQEQNSEETIQEYERYYHLLMQSEELEYSSLAQSLHGRITLFEMNQKQSLLEKENELLQKQVHLDELTGVYNRRYFDKLLYKIDNDHNIRKIGCIMIDVDLFKEYNDTYGHLQGDIILRQVAQLLTKHAIEGIYVGRFGGDEFYCLCADLEDKQIEKYLTDVYDDLHTQRIEHRMNVAHIITLSAGFCNEEKKNLILSGVMDRADQALYIAKEKGRNRFMKYTSY